MNSLRPRLGLSGGGVALAFSLAFHLGLALLATRHFRAVSIAREPSAAPIELSADFEVLSEKEDAARSPTHTDVPSESPRVLVKNSIARSVAPTTATPRAQASTAAAGLTPEPVVVNAAPDDGGPRFKLTVAKVMGSVTANIVGSTLASPGGGSVSQPFSAASVDTPAKLRAGSIPAYTAAALAASIEANVPLEIVVSESGAVSSVRGLEHVGYGLDEAARQSVLGYRFSPALRSGKAVAVRMRWLMRFQLR